MDGVLPFLKPPGITSHDAVAICRRILKEKRIGHSGTLDPMAYGVLPVFLGKATRLIEYTDGFDKTYVAECKFGTFTDTEDSSGQPVLPDTDMVLRDGVVLNESIQFSELSGSMLKPTFDELVNTVLEEDMKAAVEDLLAKKVKMSESEKGPRVESINNYIEEKLEYYKSIVETMEDDRNTDWDALEEEFRWVLESMRK